MIHINHIFLSFGEQVVFDDICWLIPERSRIALVGNNGEGKTTLFKSILGQTIPDKGNIKLPSKKTIGYLPQDLIELEPYPLIEYLYKKTGLQKIETDLHDLEKQLSKINHDSPFYFEILHKYENLLHNFELKEGYSFIATIKKTLVGLGFFEKDFEKNCQDFSGGWKMRIHLAFLLLSRPDILLLDEPTNHLDTESMEWLENWLKKYQGTFIAISHDRLFLDKMTTVTAELERGTITIYPGNYSYYLHEKKIRKDMLLVQKKEQDEFIKKTTAFVERFRYKANKASQAQSRQKQLDKLEVIDIPDDSKKAHFIFPECHKSGYEAITVKDISKSYDQVNVLFQVNVEIHYGDKIALVGINGAGKSTFSRLLSKSEEPNSGKIIYGKDVSMGFFAQESSQNLNYHNTIWEEIQEIETTANEQQKRNLLGAFLFKKEDWSKSIQVLSGGEKSRLTLCKLLLERHNLLILDEPTNHLDISTKDMFQEALKKFKGTLLIVTHDRYFLDELVHKVLEIRDHNAFLYPGNYSYFIEKRANMIKEQASSQDSNNPSAGETRNKFAQAKDDKRKEAEKRNSLYQYRKNVQELEDLIAKNEKRIIEIEAMLCSQEVYSRGGQVKEYIEQLKTLKKEIPLIYTQWHKAEEELEKAESE